MSANTSYKRKWESPSCAPYKKSPYGGYPSRYPKGNYPPRRSSNSSSPYPFSNTNSMSLSGQSKRIQFLSSDQYEKKVSGYQDSHSRYQDVGRKTLSTQGPVPKPGLSSKKARKRKKDATQAQDRKDLSKTMKKWLGTDVQVPETQNLYSLIFQLDYETLVPVSSETHANTLKWLQSDALYVRRDILDRWAEKFLIFGTKQYLPFWLHTVQYVKDNIWLFGVTQDKKDSGDTASVALKVLDFFPSFFIKIEKGEDISIFVSQFKSTAQAGRFKVKHQDPSNSSSSRRSMQMDSSYDITFHQLQYRQPALGFHPVEQGDWYMVYEVQCRTAEIRRNLVSWLRRHPFFRKRQLYHERLTPEHQFHMKMLRVPPMTEPTVAKFYERGKPHDYRTCSWFALFHFANRTLPETTCQLESYILMDNIEADATLRNNPYYGTPQLKHLFVDSETVSHGFGYPNASKPEDIAGCLCMGITQTGQSDATFGVWFCIGEVMYAGKHYLPGKTFPCYILCFRNEKEMLFEFYKWYKKNDPDAYVTWNGQNYDWPYILRRMEMHNLPTDFGRMGNSIASPWDQLQTKGFWQKKRLENENEEGQHWKDSIDFVGRLSMDGLPWFRTKFPLKAENYSLKTMANAFLRPKNQDEIDAKSEKDEKALGLTQDSDDWILKVLLKQNSHSKIDLPASKISPYFFYSPLTRYALAAYCYRDAELCWKMFRDTKMVDFYFELLGLTNANSYIAQNRGQKYLVFNRLGLHVEMLHMILNGEDFTLIKPDEYAGGFVFPPVPGLHLAAFIMDFSSLYPSLIQSYCLSYDSFLLDNVRDEKVAMRMGYEVVTIQEGGQTYKFVQLPPGKESLLNDFYKHLLAERKMHKEAVKQAKLKNDSVKITYHSTAEKAVKTLANAAYGFCGSGEKHNEGSAQRPHYKGLYYPLNGFFPIAISTTSKGRENIQKVFDSISTSGKTLTIYGDTDSVCASFTIHHAMQVVEPFRSEWSSIQNRFEKATLSDHEGKESIQTVKKDMQLLERKVLSRIYQEASNIRDSAAHKMRLTLEIENFFWFLLMMDKKKKYFGSTVTRTDQTPDIIDGKPIYYFSYGIKERGVESVRSDCPQLIRRIIRKVLTLLVEPTDEDKNFGMSGIWLCPDHPFIKKRQQRVFRQVSEFLQEQSFALVTGQVKIDELAVGKSLKADYKKLPSHAVVAKRLAKEGRPLEVGTKLYVIRIVKEGVKDEDKWEELETVLAKKLPVDYFYYFETLLFRMITRMLVATKLFQPHDLEIIFSAAKQASAQQQGNYSITRYFTAPASKTTSELLLLK